MRSLAYLSGAPRVSTRIDAEAAGPRAHIVGVVNAFQTLGWAVRPFVVGDRVPEMVRGTGSRDRLAANPLTRLAADLARIGASALNERRAFRELGRDHTLVYERFAAFQRLGRPFQRAGIPWVVESNSPLFLEATGTRRSVTLKSEVMRRERDTLSRCDAVVCVSSPLKEVLAERLGVDPEKMIVVPNAADTAMFDPARLPPAPPNAEFTVGFVGGMYNWAGLDLLVRAVAELRAAGTPLRAVLVGDGAEFQRLQALASDLRAGEGVRFEGRVSWNKIPGMIANFDACYSGQVPISGVGMMYHSPLKLYEYMAMGKPVVASDYEDAQRLVADSGGGVVFEPGDLAGLKEALRTALERAKEWGSAANRIREAIIARHSWVARMRGLLADLERLGIRT